MMGNALNPVDLFEAGGQESKGEQARMASIVGALGDGTTSVCVLAGEFLRQAAELIEKKMHPQTVVDGFRLARDAALKALEACAVDNSKDPLKFREDLMNISKTTLSSKVLSQDKDHFSKIAVDAVLKFK